MLVINIELDSPIHQITREDVDQFKEGQWIPECQLVVQWEKENQRPVQLRHKVVLTGAKAPYNYINLILNPTGQGTFICRNIASHAGVCPAPLYLMFVCVGKYIFYAHSK